MIALVSRLWRRPNQPRAEHLTFTVYSRAQCGCCTKAMSLLEDAQARYGFAIDEIDIDRDPDLVAKHDTEVPVVAVNGKIRFRGVVNRELLERLLRAESRNRPARAGAEAPPAGK
jgi:glutaredoxin